jgi:CubicO group peptidase (beta-lactamase class C family)
MSDKTGASGILARKAWRGGAAIAALALTAGLLSARAQDAPDAGPPSDAPASADAATDQAPVAAPTLPLHIPAPAPLAAPAPPPAPTARLAPGAPMPQGELEAFVDGVVRQSMQHDHIPAVTLSVVQNGQVVLKKAYGFYGAPARAADPDTTLFRLGSLSASFTWIEVLREVERGHMRLDGPINLYLPETLQVHDQGFSDPVRVRDLMDHASGFEERALGRLYERDPARVRSLETYLRQESPRRTLAPGLRSEFTDYDAALAGEALTQVTGQPFNALLEQALLRPLGMAHTSFREPYPARTGLAEPLNAALAQSLVQNYRWTGAGLQPRPFAYASQLAPAASASSTAGDMARYMTMLLNGGALDGQTLFGPATAQALRTVSKAPAPGAAGWTFGLQQQPLPGGFEGLGLDGPSLSSHADMTLAPALNLGVFAAGDSDTAGALVDALPGLIVEHFYAPPPTPPAAAAAGDLSVYAGHYVSERRRQGGLEQFVDLLTRTATVRVRPDGLLTIRSTEGDGVWAPTGAPGQFTRLGQAPAVSAFDLQDGRAVRWFAPSGRQSFERVRLFMRPTGLIAVTTLALIASLAVLIGLSVRDRRDFRQTQMQRRASALQTTSSALWLVAAAVTGVWLWSVSGEEPGAQFDWPGMPVVIASACALIAALASVGQLLALPAVWRGGRRLDSWTAGRKLTFTVTVALYMAFSVQLAMWGALEPWNS